MTTKRFEPVPSNIHFPDIENGILRYWKEHQIFEKSITTKEEGKTWTFLDGPPFITGLPHYGTLLSSIPKDLFPRYWTMKGYKVRRVWGWDCHGLPAENKVEATLGIKRKKDIEETVGVKKFIDACKTYVRDVSGEWEWYVDHVGRWVDFSHAYKTMDTPYMETVMWVFKTMYDKGYIYKGLRVSLYCPHCSTPISNFEVAMDPENYKDIEEVSTTYKYEMVGEKDTYILAWSTTPWNKIATPALAVNPKLWYVKVKQGDTFYILAETTLGKLHDETYTIVERFLGEKLIGKKFVPHYDFYAIDPGKKAFIIIGGDFVTAEEGTGVVTIAAYGEDDLKVMQKENIQIVQHIDEEGNMLPDVPKWAGMYYLKVNPLVDEDLKSRGLVYDQSKITHSVPTCWRCHTRLIFAPQNAWYVDIKKLRETLIKTNEDVRWIPEHFKYGRYQKSIETAPDWCISRSRYWGSPVPVWECECGERYVPGSIDELSKKSGKQVSDLHKPEIDEVTVICDKCGKVAKRVPEVLDSWIEAGSASFAERHYPFDQTQKLEAFYPPDFITEYTGQIRAWFYVLHVIGAALFGTSAFKNVLVSGVVLGTDGRKMSKNYGNYPDPKGLLEKYGGDALRLYLMGSSVMHGEDICISEDQYKMQIRGFLLVLWNIYNFFVLYANSDGWTPETKRSEVSEPHILDRWISSKAQSTLKLVTVSLENYDTVNTIKYLQDFITEFSQWYVRRSRDRIGVSQENEEDKKACYQTFYDVLILVTKMIAPVTPFIAEEIYTHLTHDESVHLCSWPEVNSAKIDTKLENDMAEARLIVEAIHSQRKNLKIPVRQPLANVTVASGKESLTGKIEAVILEEVNIKSITWQKGNDDIVVTLDTQITPALRDEGMVREAVRKIQMLRKDAGCKIDVKIETTIPKDYASLPAEYLEKIQRETLSDTILWGDAFHISIR